MTYHSVAYISLILLTIKEFSKTDRYNIWNSPSSRKWKLPKYILCMKLFSSEVRCFCSYGRYNCGIQFSQFPRSSYQAMYIVLCLWILVWRSGPSQIRPNNINLAAGCSRCGYCETKLWLHASIADALIHNSATLSAGKYRKDNWLPLTYVINCEYIRTYIPIIWQWYEHHREAIGHSANPNKEIHPLMMVYDDIK